MKLDFKPTNATIDEVFLLVESVGYLAEKNTEFNSISFIEDHPNALERELQIVFDDNGVTGYFEIEE